MTQTDSQFQKEYVQMIERLQKENSEYKFKLEFKERELEQCKERVKEFEGKQAIHDRIEKGLKDKIH